MSFYFLTLQGTENEEIGKIKQNKIKTWHFPTKYIHSERQIDTYQII